jgi:hypothetical protein
MIKYLLAFVVLASAVGCTQQQMAKQWGGTTTETLPKGQKLITITWKESHLWYLTRPMHSDEQAETYSFKESSNWGVMQGTVLVVESK